MNEDAGDVSEERRLADDLAHRLHQAHKRVARLPAGHESRPVLIRRLLAIGEASKRDLRRASDRLDLLLEELDSEASAHPETGEP